MQPTANLTSNVTDTALIFEGGGMRVAYTSAVVVELLRAGIFADYVVGISAGSSNTVNYLARDPERARRSFVEFAADPNFGNLRTFARGQGLFNADYIYQHTSGPDGALPLDFAAFQANPARMRIGAFRMEDGQQVWFNNDDVQVPLDLMLRVQASSTMPLLMPPVDIDGQLYVDGALGPSGGIGLDIAKADGFKKFLVILTQPRGFVKMPIRFPAAYRRVFRKYPAVVDALNDRAERYNATREELFQLEAEGKAMLFVPKVMPVGNGERSVAKLAAAHQLGLEQARAEIPVWKEWLGLG